MHPILKDLYVKNDNEGKRTPAQGFQAKRMGLRPGASDLFIAYPTKSYSGLWLEVKRDKRYTPSEMATDSWIAQQVFIETMKRVGYQAQVCYGWVDGVRIITEYLIS